MTSNKKIQFYNNQDYVKIRDECLKNQNKSWEDSSYEATYDGRSDWEWKRPRDIVNNPKFVKANIKDEPTRFNLTNINLKNPKTKPVLEHNLAVLSALSLDSSAFRFVVPEDNVEFSNSSYVGLFHFRFWRYGKCFDVAVDDRLPTRDGKLVSFLNDGNPEEFWPLILEKAYKKLSGPAESLSSTTPPELLVDLTGGISETYNSLGHTKPSLVDLETIFYKASEKGSFIIFSKHWETKGKNANLDGVYCVTKAVYVDSPKKPDKTEKPKQDKKPEKAKESDNAEDSDPSDEPEKSSKPGKPKLPPNIDDSDQIEKPPEQILLLRIFSPFVTERNEFEGILSEIPGDLRAIVEAKKNEIGSGKKYEFIIPISEFNKHDWNIYVIHLNPQQIENQSGKKIKNVYSATVDGKWVRGVSSGGNRREYVDSSFYMNPQYSISLPSPDPGSPDCAITVSVLQKSHKSCRILMNIYIFELKQKTDQRLDWDFFKHSNPIIDSLPKKDDTRELTRRFKIPPGTHLIVPATNKPQDEAHFILRVYAAQPITLVSLGDKVAHKEVDVRASVVPAMFEPVSVREADKIVQSYFDEVSGEDRVVGWKGLKKVLDFAMDYEQPRTDSYVVRRSLISYVFPSRSVFDTMENKEFSKDLARSLLATADLDHSGKLNLHEFQGLWAQIRQWIKIYEMHSDENGFLPKDNLREALDSAGYQLNSDILCSLAIRYSNKDNVIPFDDFLMCTSKLRTIFDYYKFKDPECTDQAVFTIEEWLQKSIYS